MLKILALFLRNISIIKKGGEHGMMCPPSFLLFKSLKPGLCSFGISGISGTGNPFGGSVTARFPPFRLGALPIENLADLSLVQPEIELSIMIA